MRALLHRVDDEAGVSLVELIVAVTVMLVVLAGVSRTVVAALSLSRDNRLRVTAANVVDEEMTVLRTMPFDQVPQGLVDRPTRTVDDTTYAITWESQYVAAGATAGACESGSAGGQPAYLAVKVSATWEGMRSVAPVTAQTDVGPPTDAANPYAGHVAVEVRDREDVPLGAQTVYLHQGERLVRTQRTDSSGCAFFAFLPVGSYRAVLDSPSYAERTTTRQRVTSGELAVQASQTAVWSFDYDLAARIRYTPTVDSLVAVPAWPITVANTYLQPAGTVTTPAGPWPRDVEPLFPDAAGYQAWAGDCPDADPEARDGDGGPPLHAGGTRGAPTSVEPGGSRTAGLAFAVVDVVGAAVADRDVSATSSCSSTPVFLGRASGSGRLLVAVPYGEWTFAVSGVSGSRIVTLSPGQPVVTVAW